MPDEPSVAASMRGALELLDALGRLDASALRAAFAPPARLFAVVPEGPLHEEGADAVAARFVRWFGSSGRTETLDQRIEQAPGGAASLSYRLRVLRPGYDAVVEQHALVRATDAGIARLDLVCSGFVRSAPRARGGVVEFDAGDLGCGSGLPQEFRRRLGALELGARLVVVASDPSAREDLPALARLLGQRVESVRDRDDGRVEIEVVRER